MHANRLYTRGTSLTLRSVAQVGRLCVDAFCNMQPFTTQGKIGTRRKIDEKWHFGLTKVAFGVTFARHLCVVARENAHR
jgi:hypothetical protein